MRRGILALALLLFALAAACSFVRSFDGLSDEFGRDAAVSADASAATPDATDVPDASLDAPLDVECETPVVIWESGLTQVDIAGPYLYAMDHDRDNLYVVGGSYTGDLTTDTDAGFVLRIPKANTDAGEVVHRGLRMPTTIAVTAFGIYFNASGNLRKLSDDGRTSTAVTTGTGQVVDVTGDESGIYVSTPGDGGSIGFLPRGNGPIVTRAHELPIRVFSNADGVVVARNKEPEALVRYPRADIFDGAAQTCTLDDSLVLAIDALDGSVAWAHSLPGNESHLAYSATSCAAPQRFDDLSDLRPIGLALSAQTILVRYPTYVKVFSRKNIAAGPVCTVSLDRGAGLGGNRVGRAAVFDGDRAYFFTPLRVYSMRITVR